MDKTSAVKTVVATHDESLDVRIVRQVPLVYATGVDFAIDRPGHVRAGSGLAWIDDRLAVIQDDANFMARVDTATGLADSVVLPTGHGGVRQFDDARGNKRYKNDFEAMVQVVHANTTRLLAFGSGSTALRENILVVTNAELTEPAVRVVPVPKLYAQLRELDQFSGSELNIEGAVQTSSKIRLFNRGNGAPSDLSLPINATCELDVAALLVHLEDPYGTSPPRIESVVQFNLGDIDGIRLSFTDAVAVGERVLYSAAAEDSPDAVRDGVVAGSVIGVIENHDDVGVARWIPLRNADGTLARIKVEGVAIGRGQQQLFVVVDRDEHDQPSELLELRVSGFDLR